jgi:hypothetical protein
VGEDTRLNITGNVSHQTQWMRNCLQYCKLITPSISTLKVMEEFWGILFGVFVVPCVSGALWKSSKKSAEILVQ